MQTAAISSATLTSADTDALLKLIESIRAEKSVGVASPDAMSRVATSEAAVAAVADEPGVNTAVVGDDSGHLPTLGRYVNIWA